MGVGCCFLLQGIFPTQGSNPRLLCLLPRQVDSLLLSHLGSPLVSIPFIKMWKGPSFGEWTWSICSLPMDFRYLYFILSKEEVLFFYYCCLFCFLIFVGVKLLSHVRFIATLWTVACQASLSFTISWSLLKFMSIGWWSYLTISSSALLFSFCLQNIWTEYILEIFPWHYIWIYLILLHCCLIY